MKRIELGSVATAAIAASFVMAGFVMAASIPASAADMPRQTATQPASVLTPAPTSEWVITLGAEARYMPRFEGADSMFRSDQSAASLSFLSARLTRVGATLASHNPLAVRSSTRS